MTANPTPRPHLDDVTRVGVRDLRHNLSAFLGRARDGELLIVTDRGEEIVEIRPRSKKPLGVIEQALADGRAQRPLPRDPNRARVARRAGHPTVFETLMAMREEDDR